MALPDFRSETPPTEIVSGDQPEWFNPNGREMSVEEKFDPNDKILKLFRTNGNIQINTFTQIDGSNHLVQPRHFYSIRWIRRYEECDDEGPTTFVRGYAKLTATELASAFNLRNQTDFTEKETYIQQGDYLNFLAKKGVKNNHCISVFLSPKIKSAIGDFLFIKELDFYNFVQDIFPLASLRSRIG
jgi:hypothetical protein